VELSTQAVLKMRSPRARKALGEIEFPWPEGDGATSKPRRATPANGLHYFASAPVFRSLNHPKPVLKHQQPPA
jgi:hypothetical protein